MSLIYSCCCKPKDDYSRFFCVLPMAKSLVFVSLFFAWWGAWEIYSAVTYQYFPDFFSVVILIFGILKALFFVLCVVGVILKSAILIKWTRTIFELFIAIAVFELIYYWVCWGLLLGGVGTPNGKPWEPTGEEIATMVVVTVVCILFVIFGYWIVCLLCSLRRVYQVGGSGWERRNYKEIEAEGSAV